MWILILSLLIEMYIFWLSWMWKKGDTYFINLIFLLAKYHIHKVKYSKCQTSFFKIQTWNENVFWIYWVLYELKSIKKNDFAKGLGTSLRLKTLDCCCIMFWQWWQLFLLFQAFNKKCFVKSKLWVKRQGKAEADASLYSTKPSHEGERYP